MTIRDARYPKDWPKISKRVIERAKNRCKECGPESGIVVRRKRRGRKDVFQVVSEKEFLALKQAAVKKEVKKHPRLTPEQLEDLLFRVAFAEAVKDNPSWTVMVDPDERWGYYQEGEYYTYPDDDDFDSDYTREIREL